MKTALIILAVISVLPLCRAEDALPSNVQRVVDQRAAAVAKIDQIYLQELEKLKVNYTKQGNLEVANKIVKLSKEVAAQDLDEEAVEDFLAGEWLVSVKGKNVIYPRSFKNSVMIDERGNQHPWSYKEDTVVIDWGPGRFEKLTINRSNPDVVSFINYGGVRGTYSRKQKRSTK